MKLNYVHIILIVVGIIALFFLMNRSKSSMYTGDNSITCNCASPESTPSAPSMDDPDMMIPDSDMSMPEEQETMLGD